MFFNFFFKFLLFLYGLRSKINVDDDDDDDDDEETEDPLDTLVNTEIYNRPIFESLAVVK